MRAEPLVDCRAAAQPSALRLGGITPLTTIDFPGRLAAVLYCQGCTWRCNYCHNPALLPADTAPALSWQEAQAFLQQRRGLLDGVVFSGGEPTLQAALPAALQACRALGFETGLHSAGMYPERLASLLPQLAWVGLDIKALPEFYPPITATPHSGERAWQSLDLLLDSPVEHEIRTTWHAGLYAVDALMALAQRLAGKGVRNWALQECRPPPASGHGHDSQAGMAIPPWTLQEQHLAALRSLFPRFTLRRSA